MSEHRNAHDQPIGFPVDGWQARVRPPRTAVAGHYCVVEPLSPDQHARQLFTAFQGDEKATLWTYLAYGPFATLDAYRIWLDNAAQGDDPLFYAIIDRQHDQAVGVASYLRIEPGVGVIEVGHINFAPVLQKTRAATEAMYLMMRRVFDELGYRRYEWKCDALNAGSRAAALRLGFTFEGIFRQATVYKGRNRDTAWFSIIDSEWPAQKAAFEQWLEPANFDADGRQKKRLDEFVRG